MDSASNADSRGRVLSPVLFEDRLEAMAAVARERGALDGREYDAVLADPEFEIEAFERFRTSLSEAGVTLPEQDETDLPIEPRGGRGRRPEADRDLLQRYLDDIGRFALLPHEELLRVAARVRAGDEHARRQLILANLRLVVHIARRYRDRGLPMLDLIEDGNIGLIQSVDRFDPTRGVRFSTYASLWIRQAVVRGLAEQSRAVRIPVQLFQEMNRLVRVQRTLTAALGREPLDSEVAREMRLPVERVSRLSALVDGTRAHEPADGVDAFEDLSHEDHAPGAVSVEQLVELQLQHEKLDRLLRTLSQRESQVLRIRYGFVDGISHSLQETGDHFGISRERVRQIEARALGKLRETIRRLESDADRTSSTLLMENPA